MLGHVNQNKTMINRPWYGSARFYVTSGLNVLVLSERFFFTIKIKVVGQDGGRCLSQNDGSSEPNSNHGLSYFYFTSLNIYCEILFSNN